MLKSPRKTVSGLHVAAGKMYWQMLSWTSDADRLGDWYTAARLFWHQSIIRIDWLSSSFLLRHCWEFVYTSFLRPAAPYLASKRNNDRFALAGLVRMPVRHRRPLHRLEIFWPPRWIYSGQLVDYVTSILSPLSSPNCFSSLFSSSQSASYVASSSRNFCNSFCTRSFVFIIFW